jgi:hypothetical protein
MHVAYGTGRLAQRKSPLPELKVGSIPPRPRSPWLQVKEASMEHDAAQTSEHLRLHSVRFADAPAATWEAAMALLARAVTLAGIHLRASDGRMERQDATKLMAALIDLGDQEPSAPKRDAGGAEPVDVGATLGSR